MQAPVFGVGDAARPCHSSSMIRGPHHAPLHRRLIDALYEEAMLLADEARSYFDEPDRGDRGGLDPFVRVEFSCESLKLRTRLMHVIAWLLTQKAVLAGEINADDAAKPSHRLGTAARTEEAMLDALPTKARGLVEASIDLHRRLSHIEQALLTPARATSPALSMQIRLGLAL